jgi:hypothetical protein
MESKDKIEDNKHIVEEIKVDDKIYYVDRNKSVFNNNLELIGIMKKNNKIEYFERKKKKLEIFL